MPGSANLNPREDFEKFLSENGTRLRQKLGDYNGSLIQTSPEYFEKDMEYFTAVNAGGKMLRAVLVNLGYYICGGTAIEYSDELALSLEVFQSSILIHDDLLDHGAMRRGIDTVHVRLMKDYSISNEEILKSNPDVMKDFTNGVSVALGYLGLYLAYEKLLDAYGKDANLLRILKEYNDIVIKTVEGGIMDVIVPFTERYKDYIPVENTINANSFDVTERLALLKTAYYTTMGPIVLGMMLSGASDAEVFAVSEVMKDVGLAFQIQDDILGIYGDEEEVGKDIGSDVSEFKQTFMYAFVKVENPDVLSELNKYYGKDEVSADDLECVRRIFKDTGAFDFTYNKMKFHYNRAKDNLAEIQSLSEESKSLILGFILYLESRKK